MKTFGNWLERVLSNVYIRFLSEIGAAVSLIIAIEGSPNLGTRNWGWWTACILGLILFASLIYYSITKHNENSHFRATIKILHHINHDYRNALCENFKNTPDDLSNEEYWPFVTKNERETIKSVCEKAAQIYSLCTNRPCVVSVKLITREDNKAFCETYQRSETKSTRDIIPEKFVINTCRNTAFDEALRYFPGKISHFYSTNLRLQKDYHNDRQNWRDFYNSTIVVPIRFVITSNHGKPGEDLSHDMGFLSVDTLSPDRLNNTWHVQLLASLADQMYNFLSLTRGQYRMRTSVPI